MTKRYIGVGQYSTRRQVFHTDTDCRFAPDEMREVSESEIEYHDMRLCKWCDPDKNPNSGSKTNRDAYQALVKLGEQNADV